MDSSGHHPAGAFRTEFAVSMTCQSCVDSITNILHRDGILSANVNLEEQQVVVESTAPPSAVMRLLRDTGRTVIVRGLSYSGVNSSGSAPLPGEAVAGVAMMEHLHRDWKVKDATEPGGLIRLVRANERLTLLDLTLHDIREGEHSVVLHALGDLQDIPNSCGEGERSLGTVHVGKDGHGDLVAEVAQPLWELIGHSIVVGGRLAGVIARSSGAFDNDKKICACDGRTMWEEARLSKV